MRKISKKNISKKSWYFFIYFCNGSIFEDGNDIDRINSVFKFIKIKVKNSTQKNDVLIKFESIR